MRLGAQRKQIFRPHCVLWVLYSKGYHHILCVGD
ncbi:hypothetical protein LEMLEM_LOCUS3888 [Lemmus lemmus]